MNANPLLKGTLQTIILKLLEDYRQMYGYEIIQKVKEATAGELALTESALYSALHKLEGDAMLTTTTAVVDGRARKYYSLTDQGGKEVAHKMEEARVFMEHLQNLLNLRPAL